MTQFRAALRILPSRGCQLHKSLQALQCCAFDLVLNSGGILQDHNDECHKDKPSEEGSIKKGVVSRRYQAHPRLDRQDYSTLKNPIAIVSESQLL